MARSLTAGNKFSEMITSTPPSEEAAADDKALDHVVADPQEDEQRADVRIPEDFQPDAPVPEVPDLTGAFFGPPGWVIGGIASGVLGLASAVVGASEGVSRSHTEPLDRGF